ncbi:hypothetical protein ACFW6E_26155 [Streptomyces olivaceoviridis]|uniref:hypothetical protein n=1 Tax=Streptomyces olivaceoviridis TaxID=1921 RepID=UPI0036A3C54C
MNHSRFVGPTVVAALAAGAGVAFVQPSTLAPSAKGMSMPPLPPGLTPGKPAR